MSTRKKENDWDWVCALDFDFLCVFFWCFLCVSLMFIYWNEDCVLWPMQGIGINKRIRFVVVVVIELLQTAHNIRICVCIHVDCRSFHNLMLAAQCSHHIGYVTFGILPINWVEHKMHFWCWIVIKFMLNFEWQLKMFSHKFWIHFFSWNFVCLLIVRLQPNRMKQSAPLPIQW